MPHFINSFWPIISILIFFLKLVWCLKTFNWVNSWSCKPDRDSVSVFLAFPQILISFRYYIQPQWVFDCVNLSASSSLSRITSQGLSFLRTCPRLFKRWRGIMFLLRDKHAGRTETGRRRQRDGGQGTGERWESYQGLIRITSIKDGRMENTGSGNRKWKQKRNQNRNWSWNQWIKNWRLF